jgi:hypothetical protein
MGMLSIFPSCTSGSKEFNDAKAQISNLEKQINDAETCDDLLKVVESFLNLVFSDAEYEGKDVMTEAEKTEIQKMMDDLSKVAEAKTSELGC